MSAQAPSYYDKVLYNTLHFKKKRGASHEFGHELEAIIPSAGEIRLLGNRNRQCTYYQIGKSRITPLSITDFI